ncbi:MAG TPA: RidA family protein [Planctomycetota bacterium]|nr:RidA family protein [Planctomycetota bacterium]
MSDADPEPSPLQVVLPEGWPRPRGYSQAIRVPAGRELLFVSGQVGWDERGQFGSADFVPQFEQALRNCAAVVVAAGGSAADIVRLTMFCRDRRAYLDRPREVGEAYRRVMGGHYPAMALMEVSALMEDGAQVEIEATAAVPASRKGG